MSKSERHALIEFCIYARSELEGVSAELIDSERSIFEAMSDKELEEESDWLDELLGK